MEANQNSANEIAEIDKAVKSTIQFVLSPQQQMWVDYNALGGLVTDLLDEGEIDDSGKVKSSMRKMPITEFANLLGVDRGTLRNWRNNIPDFWGLVNKRRQELTPTARLAKVHEVWFLSALKPGNEGFRDRQMFLANFDPDFHMPTQPVEHGIANSWSKLLENVRAREQNVIEAEVTKDADANV